MLPVLPLLILASARPSSSLGTAALEFLTEWAKSTSRAAALFGMVVHKFLRQCQDDKGSSILYCAGFLAFDFLLRMIGVVLATVLSALEVCWQLKFIPQFAQQCSYPTSSTYLASKLATTYSVRSCPSISLLQFLMSAHSHAIHSYCVHESFIIAESSNGGAM
jgi:hypothetical protein